MLTCPLHPFRLRLCNGIETTCLSLLLLLALIHIRSAQQLASGVFVSNVFLDYCQLLAIAIPLLALILTPLLRRLLVRVTRHQYPLLSQTTPK